LINIFVKKQGYNLEQQFRQHGKMLDEEMMIIWKKM
jgi:hypothetical protein